MLLNVKCVTSTNSVGKFIVWLHCDMCVCRKQLCLVAAIEASNVY